VILLVFVSYCTFMTAPFRSLLFIRSERYC